MGDCGARVSGLFRARDSRRDEAVLRQQLPAELDHKGKLTDTSPAIARPNK